MDRYGALGVRSSFRIQSASGAFTLRACRVDDLVVGLALTACTWMAKWFYAMSGRRVMDERLAPDFVQQMTRRYGIATLIQIAAVVAPRPGGAIALLCASSCCRSKPRYKLGKEPSAEEKLDE